MVITENHLEGAEVWSTEAMETVNTSAGRVWFDLSEGKGGSGFDHEPQEKE